MINPIGSMYAICGKMDPINIPPMLAYIPYMDPMGMMINHQDLGCRHAHFQSKPNEVIGI